MKIGDSAGHTTSCQGANLYVNEVTEVRRILPIVNELLKPYHTIVNCQPPESYMYPQEINFRVQKSDNSGCDLYFSIHLNSSSKTDAPIGSEVLIYMGTPLTTKIGNAICSNLASLGFKNRGLKDGVGFAEVSSINCPSMIIEVFFVSSKADCDLYKKLGVEKIARAIANGIDSRVSLNASNPLEQKPQVEMHRNIIIYNNGAEADKACAEYFAMILNSKNEDCVVIDYQSYRKALVDGRSIFAVGGSLEGKFKYDNIFKGKDRNETAQQVLEHLKKY